jgi:hypothetical protein
VAQFGDFDIRFAVERHQPTVQVVGQHRQLEMIAIYVEAERRMRRQPGIVVRLFDQVCRAAPLIVILRNCRRRSGAF